MTNRRLAAALAAAGLCAGPAAEAHVIAGDRVFPVTLTFDDPGTADEATLPQFTWQPTAGGETDSALQWEYDKTITPNTAIILNHGWNMLTPGMGQKAQTGFENVFLTAKWQAITDAEHEFVVSLGVIREFGGGYTAMNVGGDYAGATSPTVYFGKGLGDLPIGLLRPLAVTGELSYWIPDRRLDSTLDNNGVPASVTGGLSIQYSVPYLQSQVRAFALPDFVSRLIPLVETTWYSPTQRPASGLPMTLTIAPGVIYMADSYQVGLEALIPGNRAAGPHVGGTAQLHFFFDDLFPDSIGRPLFH